VVLRVSEAGVVTGYAPGSARITATPVGRSDMEPGIVPEPEAEANAAIVPGPDLDPAGDSRVAPAASVQLTVVPDPARILTVSPAEARVVAGQVLHLTAQVRTGDGRELADGRVHWSSSPLDSDRPARVDPDGAFVAPEQGTWLVTATRGRLSSASVVRVSARTDSLTLASIASGLPPGPFATSAGVRVFEGADGRDWAWVWTDAPARLDLWDVSDPASPVFVRSLDPGAERITGVAIGPETAWAVVATSGAGAPVFDLSDPSEPREITRITHGPAPGASAVATDRDHVWLASESDGSLAGFDLGDPGVPVPAGSWSPGSGRIEDLEVRDGLALLAHGGRGLTILDVGAGIQGGSAARPVRVSELRSFHAAEAESGSATVTHVRRWRDWILLGESIRDCEACDLGPRGAIRIIDVTDIRQPRQVAWYSVPEAGVRDLEVDSRGEWLSGAFGTGGARMLDLSGELRGDRYEQGRELASAPTGAWWPGVPTRSMARGVRSLKGWVFVADMYAGLRVFRIVTGSEDE
jgi:hypothetical protein